MTQHPLPRARDRSLARTLTALAIILLFAFALRTIALDYTDVEGDEAFSYSFSMDTLEGIVRTTLNIGEPHPVGSYFFLHYWLQLAGQSDLAFRFPSAWFGVLVVAVIYRLGRRLHLSVASSREAVPIVAALLVTFSPFLIAESRDARMYSMSLGLTVTSTWLALELLATPGRANTTARKGLFGLLTTALPARAIGLLVAYILVSVYALNVHYFAGTILVAQNVFVLAQTLLTPLRIQKRRLVRWVMAQLAVLLAFAPWYLMASAILRGYGGMAYRAPALDWMIQLMAGIFTVGERAPEVSAIFAALAGLILAVGIARLVFAGSRQRWGALLLALYIVVPFAMAYLDSRDRATFAERQVIAATAGFYLLAAAGIAPVWAVVRAARRNWLKVFGYLVLPGTLALALTAGVVLGLRGYYIDQRGRPSAWQPFVELAQRYSANVAPEQLRIAQNFPDPAISFYYKGNPPAIALPFRNRDEASTLRAVQDLAAAGVQRVILRMDVWNSWNGGREKDIAQTALATAFTKVYETFTGRWTIAVYSRIDPADLKPGSISFANGLTLAGAATRSLTDLRASIPGKTLEVHLRWKGDAAALKGTEKLFIHVIDRAGQVPAQLDVSLTTADIQTPVKTYGVPIADTLPAGSYFVRIGIYDPGQTGAPRLRTSDNSDGIQIGAFTIED